MKRNNTMKWTAIAVVLLGTCLYAGEATFRETTWGMSREEVNETESSRPLRLDNGLAYAVEVAGLDGHVIYIFTENKLMEALYLFEEKHSNFDNYVTDYEHVHGILTGKYGKPAEDTWEWKVGLYSNDKAKWGTAVAMGRLVGTATWETEETRITMTLKGYHFEVTHSVKYESVALKALAEAEERQREADDF